jgi:hypothetical protein
MLMGCLWSNAGAGSKESGNSLEPEDHTLSGFVFSCRKQIVTLPVLAIEGKWSIMRVEVVLSSLVLFLASAERHRLIALHGTALQYKVALTESSTYR